MQNKKKPAQAHKGFEINNGNPIRKVTVTNGCRYYQVDLRHTASGKPVRRNFTSAQKACSFASKAMAKAAGGPLKAVRPGDSQREIQEILNPFNVTLGEAALFYARYHGAVDSANRVDTLIRSFISEKQNQTDRHELQPASLVDIRHFLKRFSKAFSSRGVDTVTAGEIDCFLDTVRGEANRRSHRLYISAFFNWAVENGRLPANPVRRTRRVAKAMRTPGIYHPGQVRRIMGAAEPELVPYMALSLFSGARSMEILKLRWSDVDFDAEEIRVVADTSCTQDARTLHMPPNLVHYLAPFRGRPEEPVVPHGQRSLQRWTKKLFKELEIKSVYQGARHSFAMHHLALHPLAQTMHELGCRKTETLLRYVSKMTRDLQIQADEYFAIVPISHVEIIPLKKEAA